MEGSRTGSGATTAPETYAIAKLFVSHRTLLTFPHLCGCRDLAISGHPSTTMCGFLPMLPLLHEGPAQCRTPNSVVNSSEDHQGTVADSGLLNMAFITFNGKLTCVSDTGEYSLTTVQFLNTWGKQCFKYHLHHDFIHQ